MFRQT